MDEPTADQARVCVELDLLSRFTRKLFMRDVRSIVAHVAILDMAMRHVTTMGILVHKTNCPRTRHGRDGNKPVTKTNLRLRLTTRGGLISSYIDFEEDNTRFFNHASFLHFFHAAGYRESLSPTSPY